MCFDARLQQHLGRLDVVHRIDVEIASPALSDAGLRRQVKHVRPVGQQRRQVGRLNRRFDEPESRLTAQAARFRSLMPRVVIGEAVDADDVGAVGEQPFGKRRTDEAGDAGDERLHTKQRPRDAVGKPARPAVPIERRVDGPAGRQCEVVRQAGRPRTRIAPAPETRSVPRVRTSSSSSYRAGRRYAHCASMTGQADAVGFDLAIAPSRRAQQIRPADLEPDEVVRVVDDAHLVGFRVADADPRHGRRMVATASVDVRRDRVPRSSRDGR